MKVLITGVTGLVGSYLAKILLQNNHTVYALARSKEKSSAVDRVKAFLNFWDPDLKIDKNLIVIEADIIYDDLGLNDYTRKLLQTEVEEIFHCAAVTKFNLPFDEIRKPNIDGTKNVLDFAICCKNLKKINHISTAYVAGNYRGIFKEENLDLGQNFNTTYEKSKFEAEKIVYRYREKLWIDIYRPPLVVGSSKDCKTPTFSMAVYQVLHLWKQEILDVFPCKDVNINVVPVDLLCESIFLISSKTKQKNKNYHPFSSKTICLEKIMNWLAEKVKFKKPKALTINEFKNVALSPVQKMLLANNLAIFNPDLVLDCSFTEAILENYGFRFQDSEQILPILLWPFKVGFKNQIT